MDSNAERVSTRDCGDDHQPVRRIVLAVIIGMYLLGVGGLVGALIERIRFNYRRDAVVARYDDLLRSRNATLMTIEREIAQESRTTDTDSHPVNLMGQN
jgi:hypothetical protein